MIFRETALKGAFIISPKPFQDDRGFFARWFCKNEFKEKELVADFVQCNQSGTIGKGSIRGMHFQYPPHAEVKLVKCISGRIWDVIIDIRKGSGTYLNWFGIELSQENKEALYIPAGFAHGFQTLTDNAEIIYMVSEYYNKESEGGIRFNDETVGITWPLALNTISEKDLNIPLLQTTQFSGIGQ